MTRANRRRAAWCALSLLLLGALVFRTLWPHGDASPPDDRRPSSAKSAEPRPAAERKRDVAAPAEPDASSPPAATTPDDVQTPPAKDDHAPAAALEVTVLRADGTPAVGATTSLVEWNWLHDRFDHARRDTPVPTDARGVATVRTSSQPVRVLAWLGAEAGSSREMLTLKDVRAVTVRLSPAATVRGRVVLDGEPVASADVTISAATWFGSGSGFDLATRTGADGRFELPPIALDGLDAAHPPVVAARAGDAASGEVVVAVEALRRGDDVVVEVDRGVTVRATFVNEKGRPVRDVIVRPAVRREHAVNLRDGNRLVLRLPRDAGKLVATWPTDHSIVAGYSGETAYIAIPYMAKALGAIDGGGGELDLGDVVLRPGRPVVGHVVDAANRPARHAAVHLRLDGVEVASTATDDDGRFEIPEVGDDAHELYVRREMPGYGTTSWWTTETGVMGGDGDVRVVLIAEKVVTLRFLSSGDRAPLAAAEIAVRVSRHGDATLCVDERHSGSPTPTFEIELRDPGSYDVAVEVSGYAAQRFDSVEVVAGRPTSLDVMLSKKRD